MNKEFIDIINSNNRIVFFGGAGVSTESGIPDFRSVDGLYNQKYDYPPETILSYTFFRTHTSEFYRFYRDKMIIEGAQPNKAHMALAFLEEKGKITGVVTQNIDGLHQLAGTKKVYELHGSIHRNYCMKCGKFYGLDAIRNSNDIPHCECGGIIKPDVVLYEEALDEKTINDSVYAISHSDVLIIGGTSLAVYPAAGLIRYFNGNRIILINKGATPADDLADLIIREPIAQVMGELL